MVEGLKSGIGAIREAMSGARMPWRLMAGGAGVGGTYAVYSHPPVRTVGQGERGVRENRFTGEVTQWRDGSVLVLPVVHDMRIFSLREQTYRPENIARAAGTARLQSR